MTDSSEKRQLASKELVEALSYEGQKDAWLDDLLAYLHFDPTTQSHPDWVARAQAAEAELAKLKAPTHETGVSADSRDAARWRAFVRSTGHEVDMSTGPGKNKDLHIRINCTGCERYFESGAPDYEGTLNATMDDEIKLQANELKARVVPSVCGKPMPDGNGARQCINVPGHEGECDDMPF